MSSKKIIGGLIILVFSIFTLWSNAQSVEPGQQKVNDTLTNKDKMKMKTEKEWKEVLTPMQFYVLREKGTERAFTGEYDKFYEKGTYHCAGCNTALFESETKFNSGCGWPAFYAPLLENNVNIQIDRSHGMIRSEVLCATCGGHLGHVFEDGPEPTGLRYCINSAALDFVKSNSKHQIPNPK
jgi:peptide-methionine (R)-S-oxide reductase